ncbi:metallophosphoesterase [Mesorhizobium denitrificans]|uniref:Metallophosphoesterase n=2 Tax=Phyllobacteriaceae TaxID=69277 RepID=A0A371XHS1_9HYPH|nr:metallophosphoesterase [Mesorhizobium denitrificans]
MPDRSGSTTRFPISRRVFMAGSGAFLLLRPSSASRAADEKVTFIFIADVHACRMGAGLSPNCQQEGKTDANLLRHIRALNDLEYKHWPEVIDGNPTGLANAGKLIGRPRGVVVGGDMTDDGGGQTAERDEGTQILQFSHRYREGTGPDMVHVPVYSGLGNHDLDQDGRPPDTEWYRDELRDYVRFNHENSVFFKPPVPAANFDPLSDCYSWDWGPLHLVQLHRFGGDTRKGAVSALPWLKQDLATNAANGKPVVLFQHYGWDPFSTERWDPAKSTFDDTGHGKPHWWTQQEQQALLDTITGANVIGIFHGHEHDTPMIYRTGNIDLFKPIASFKGGFALAELEAKRFSVVLGQAFDEFGGVKFTNAFQKASS